MPKNQGKLDDRAQIVPLSLYPQTLAQLSEIQRLSGESRGAVVRRLVEREAERQRGLGIRRAPVWTFPSYDASGPRIETRVVLRRADSDDLIFKADGERLFSETTGWELCPHRGR